MGNTKLRTNRRCLNCGSWVEVRYCSACGQENIEPKESFGSMIHHFFADITHFDGKFFSTAKYLFTKPGFLSKEYIVGRRASYFHPIRMYVFTSAFFFLIFFWAFNTKKIETGFTASGSQTDSLYFSTTTFGRDYLSVQQYDSVQAALPKAERDGWIYRKLTRKSLDLAARYQTNAGMLLNTVLDKFFHSFPYLLFISLPLYALYLKILYLRKKEFYYADHGVFLIHLYIFSFLVFLLGIAFYKLQNYAGFGWVKYLLFILAGYGVWYAFTAMRRFYYQTAGKTLFKFLLFNILAVISLVALFSLFFIISIFRV